MEVTGKLHTLVCLPPGEKFMLLTEYKGGRIPELAYTMWRAGKLLPFAHD